MSDYTIWDSINNGNNPIGAVIFSNAQGTPSIDYLNLYYNSANAQLYVGNNGDISGTDTLNLYRQGDSYVPVANQVIANNINGGWTVSTSRGNGPAAMPNLTGDFIGEYSGFAYLGDATLPANSGVYVRMAGMNSYVLGASLVNPGGEGRLHAKKDGGASIELMGWNVDVNGVQSFYPIVDGGTNLGKVGKGIGKIYLQSTGVAAIVVGAQIINKESGKFGVANGQQTAVITDSLLGPNDVVIGTLLTVDATAKSVVCVNNGNGTFTANLNAAASSGQVNVHFELRAYS